jgi:DNA invertase Pin-like site-specific DNA recombinase
MKAAAYLRVSTDGQVGEDKFGLPSQQEAIQDFARSNGLEIVEWYSDEGYSGGVMERPGLQELIRDAGNNGFKIVIAAKMDRVARDLMAQLWIEKELLKSGVELVSVAEPFRGQDPANVLFRQVIGAFAQFEKARIAERMLGGRKQKAKAGGYAGGGAPIGYTAQLGRKTLEIDETKISAVKRVFAIRNQNPGVTLREMARKLNEEGFTTAENKPFRMEQVRRIIQRESIYKGTYQYAGVQSKGKYEAII